MTTFLGIFVGLAAVCWLFSWVLFAKFRTVPASDSSGGGATISVIIPARNEESNLAKLLSSLTGPGFRSHEIIVLDDNSTDQTAKVARQHGARVIHGKPLPDGWFGKPWACVQAAAEATGDYLLFLDADTWLEPGGLERIAGLSSIPQTAHAICPYHQIQKPYEELSSFFNVIMLLGTNAFSVRGDQARGIGLFGQALFVARSDYEAIGGHENVKREVLENFQLARHFREAGIRCRCYLGRGTISMRMFPNGFQEMAGSWGKGFVSGSKATARNALIGISIWLSGLMTITVALGFLAISPPAVFWSIIGLYLAYALQTRFVFKKAGTFSMLNALFFPLSLLYYQIQFFESIFRRRSGKRVDWKGRDVSSA